MKMVKYWAPVYLLILFIYTVSSLPVEVPTGEAFWPFTFMENIYVFMLFKKLTHVGEYGLLYLLLVRAFKNASSIGQSKYFILSLLLVGLTGFGDEYHQAFIPGGGLPHIHDVVIDLFGALAAYIFIWKLLPRMPMKLRSLAKILELN